MSGKLRPKTRNTKTQKTKTWKTKTLFFFSGKIIKFQLSFLLSGKMNEMNALTLTNNNFSFPGLSFPGLSFPGLRSYVLVLSFPDIQVQDAEN